MGCASRLGWVVGLVLASAACAPGDDGPSGAAEAAADVVSSGPSDDAGSEASARADVPPGDAPQPAPQGAAQEADLDDPAAGLAARASALTDAGEHAAAVELWRAVIERRGEGLGAQHALTGRGWHNLSFALCEAREYDAALDAARRSVEIAVAHGEPSPQSGMARGQLADVAERAGRFELAWTAAEAACADFEASFGKTPMTGEAHERAGRLAQRVGDLHGAEQHLHWAVAIAERTFGLSDPLRVARPLIALAGVLASGGRCDGALQLLEHAGLLLESRGLAESPEWSMALATRVDLLEELGERRHAAELLERLAARVALSAGAPEAVRRAGVEQALRLARLGDVARARALLPELADDPRASPTESVAILGVRAELAWRRGDLGAAGDALERALALRADSTDLLAGMPLQLLRGRVLHERGDERAVTLLLELFGALRRAAGEAHPAVVEPLLALLAAEHDLHGETLELRDALEMTREALEGLAPGRLAALLREPGRGGLDAYADAWLAVAAQREASRAAAFEAVDAVRERTLLEPLAWWLERGAAAASAELLELGGLRREFAAGTRAPAERAAFTQRLRAAEADVLAADPAWARLLVPRGAELDAARAWLPTPGARLLAFSWTGERLWLQLVAPEPGRDAWRDLGPTADLAPLLARAQAWLRDAERRDDGGVLAELGEVLLAPVWDGLADCDRALVVADGPLAWLPFEALPMPAAAGDARAGRPWVERCRVGYAPSVARLLAHARDRPRAQAHEGALHVVQSGRFPERPAPDLLTRLRGRFVVTPRFAMATGDAEVLPDGEQTLWSRDALESSLARRSEAGGLRGLRVLELAQPLYLDGRVPSATALVVGPEPDDDRALWEREDGLLQPHELAALDLDVDVVLLPMGELGPDPAALDLDPSGLHALVAALWRAGAGQVLVSSWSPPGPPRPDFERALMRRLRDGDPHDALWRTQVAWLGDARERGPEDEALHPGRWARLRAYGP